MVNLTASGDTIKFEFENSPHYLYNGTIEVPKNSLSMVMDDSEMVTFKKSASNDIFVSIRYSELGKTKNEMLSWYKDNMVKDYVDEGEVDEQIEEATQNYFDGAEYDSNSKRINFKHGSTIKGYIDASDFVIDGMVDDVEIENGYLVITFNTDSGKQPISIPLSDIFNPNDYYTKTDIDTTVSGINSAITSVNDALTAHTADTSIHLDSGDVQTQIDNSISGKVDTSVFTEKERVVATALNDLNDSKVDTSIFNTFSGNVETALSGKQDTLVAGDNITISGNVISSEGGNNVVTLTQAEYDALETKDPTAFYIISDAEEIDLNNYYTKSETSGATQISAALSGKQNTLIAGSGITISGNVISAEGGGGGGKAVSAGTNISITTGETADTINCTLPISADTNTIRINKKNIKIGTGTITTSNLDRVQVAIGDGVTANGVYSFAFGAYANATNYNTVSMGFHTESNNQYQVSFGQYNVSSNANNTFGDSGNTLFSVGNGTSSSARHNAFEIRQNGDIYLTKDGQDVKLQDQLGGGSSYTAGDGIDITNDVISVTGKVSTSAITTSVTSSSTDAQVPSAKAVNDKLGGLSLVKLTQAEYDSLATKDSNTLYVVTDS